MGVRPLSRQRVVSLALLPVLAFVAVGCGEEEVLKPDQGVSPFTERKVDDSEAPAAVRPVTKRDGNEAGTEAAKADGTASKAAGELPPSLNSPQQFTFEDLDKLNKVSRTLAEKGQVVEAAKGFDQVLGADPTNRSALFGRAASGSEMLSILSDQDRAVEVGRDADLMRTLKKKYSPMQPVEIKAFGIVLFNEAAVLGNMGEHDKALEVLKEAVDGGFTSWGMVEASEQLKVARSKPLYENLLARMKDTARANAYRNVKQRLENPLDFPFDFKLKDVDGKPVALADFKGKVILVDLWGTWCGPCLMAIPGLTDLHRKYSKDGLVIVGIAREKVPADEARKLVKEFVTQNKIPYPCLIGDEAIESQIPFFQGYPTSIIIDAKGKIRFGATGAQEGQTQAIEDAVIVLLDERNGKPAETPAKP